MNQQTDQVEKLGLKEFHKTWYAPNNAILLIVGDVNPEKTMAMARRLFEEIQAAFAQWIRPDDLVQITLGPEPR